MASLIEKAVRQTASWVSKASRGTLSSYVVNAPHQYGQPLPQSVDAGSLITPERMRELAMRTPTCAAAVNAILDYAVNTPIRVRNVDHAQPADPARVALVEALLRTPNSQDTERRFREKLLRDLVTLGFGGLEKEGNTLGGLANLWVLDAARLKVDYDEHGIILGWDMLDAHGIPIVGPDNVHAWLPGEVIWFERDAVSNSQYPISRLAQLFSAGVLEDLMLAFIGGRFTDSNVPYGVFDLGDITNDELKKAVSLWNAQARANHRILLTGSKGSSHFYPFGYHLRDLEAPKLLAQIRSSIMGVLGVTENELGQSQDVNKSNGYNLSYTFKKRAIEPLLAEYCETLTVRLLWETLGYHDLELYYDEIDSRDELLAAQIDDLVLKQGTASINQVRNRKGDVALSGGDEPMLFTGSAWVPISMAQDFADSQLRAVQAEALLLEEQVRQARMMNDQLAAAPAGGDSLPGNGSNGQAGITAPLIRGPQPPDRFTTPDGSGSSTVKIKYPKPSVPKPQGQPQKPRGPVQTLRNQGLRKEEQQG